MTSKPKKNVKRIRRHGEQTATIEKRPTKGKKTILTPPKKKPAP